MHISIVQVYNALGSESVMFIHHPCKHRQIIGLTVVPDAFSVLPDNISSLVFLLIVGAYCQVIQNNGFQHIIHGFLGVSFILDICLFLLVSSHGSFNAQK